MNIRLTFKTPDVLSQIMEENPEFDKEEIKVILNRWIRYEKYITIDFVINKDPKKCTAQVMEYKS